MSQPTIIYQNVFDGTLTASGTATGFVVDNIKDFRPFTYWKADALTATITVDNGTAVSCDYLLVYGHDLNTQGATIELRGSTDNFSASDVLVKTITPTNDDNFAEFFTASTAYRYWRIQITGTTVPTLAIISAGLKLTIPSYLDEGFDPIGRTPMVKNNRSRNGHPIGKVIQFQEYEQTLKFPLVTWTWVRDTWAPAWEAWLKDNPFVFVWEIDTYSSELRLITIDGGFKTPHKAGQWADLQLKIEGVYE